MSYGPDYRDLNRHTAEYVDKILMGVKAGDLPVYQADQLQLALNLKTARALGVTIPQSLLIRADAVVE